MRLGLALPQYGYSLPNGGPTWNDLRKWATRADGLGFESLWLADHLVMSIEKYGGPEGDHEGFEPVTALSALASVTTNARLGILVACSQLRPPGVLAKQIATLDVLSQGRVELGLGAGWHPPDFALSGLQFPSPRQRLAQLEAAMTTIDRDLRGEGPPLEPHPVQAPRPPVFMGGRGDRLLDLVARHADGWNTAWRIEPDWYRDRLRVLRQACDRHDRDPASVELSIGLYTLVGENDRELQRRFERLAEAAPPGVMRNVTLGDWRQGHLVGTLDQVGEQLDSWRALSVSRVIVGLSAVPFGGVDVEDLEILASLIR